MLKQFITFIGKKSPFLKILGYIDDIHYFIGKDTIKMGRTDLYPNDLTLINITNFKFIINQNICDSTSIGKYNFTAV